MPEIIDPGNTNPGESESSETAPLSSESSEGALSVSPADANPDLPNSESVFPSPPEPPSDRWIYRHTIPVRLAHWINVLCLPILVMSGFQIFNAHPALYWGERSDRDRPILSMSSALDRTGRNRGETTVFGHAFDTTGLLGLSEDSQGQINRRGFPGWATIPSFRWLAMGRRWHFFFAWIFVLNGIGFGLYALLSRHLDRDLVPFPKDLRSFGRSVLDHLLFRHPKGEEAARYNVLQKIAYTGVIFVLGPLIVLTGLTMSPRMDAAFPVLLTLFGGRQSARTIHFIVCFAFVGYTLVHLFMVAVSGVWNNLRSMLHGRYRVAGYGVASDDSRSD